MDGEDIVDFIDLLSDEKKQEMFERNEYSYNLYRQGLIRESTLGGIIKEMFRYLLKKSLKKFRKEKS